MPSLGAKVPHYLGGTERRTDVLHYPHRALFVFGSHFHIANFRSTEEMSAYTTQVMDIRSAMASLNQDRVDGRIEDGVYGQRLKDEWIPLVDGFITWWGEEFVPGDIRFSVNNIEENLGIQPRMWPELVPCTTLPA